MGPPVILILVLSASLAGCATPGATAPEATGPATVMPDDWSLDVTILVGRDADDRGPAHLRASRYTVFPDGSLHYADAAEDAYQRGTDWLPPRTRTLPEAEATGVWELARALGFAGPTAGEPPRNIDLIRPPDDGRAIIIEVCGNDTRRMFVFRSGDGQPEDDAERLIRRLAVLAWADDRVGEHASVRPSRYDLGPDPYARYRRP